MKLLIVRHGVAEDPAAFHDAGGADRDRPLTKVGRRKFRRGVAGLRTLVPKLDWIATSPLVRAVQTGEILAEAYEKVKTTQISALVPNKNPRSVLQWLQKHPADACIAVVGHEPQLGLLASWLLTGLQHSFMPLKKGGACLLEFDDGPKPGRATLSWSLRPSHFRKLG